MGLANRSEPGLISRILSANQWLFAMVLVFASVLVAGFGEEGRLLLRYDRTSIEGGQLWRFLSAHVTHLGVSHMVLNMVGLLLVWALVGRHYTVSGWIAVAVVAIVSQSVGFWLLDPGMQWYVGLSGTLHGFMIAGALRGLRIDRLESSVLLVLVVGKLAYEQFAGPLPGSEATAGGNVVVNAHLYGGIGGALAAAGLFHRARRQRSI